MESLNNFRDLQLDKICAADVLCSFLAVEDKMKWLNQFCMHQKDLQYRQIVFLDKVGIALPVNLEESCSSIRGLHNIKDHMRTVHLN